MTSEECQEMEKVHNSLKTSTKAAIALIGAMTERKNLEKDLDILPVAKFIFELLREIEELEKIKDTHSN